MDFLVEALADGPRSQPEVLKSAREHGISEKTLRRAKGELRIRSEPRYESGRRGAVGHDWLLPSPTSEPKPDLHGQPNIHDDDGHLNASESETATPVEVFGHLNPAHEEVF